MKRKIFLAFLALIPISLGLHYFAASPLLVFATAVLAIIPLAEWIRRATEQLSHLAGSVIGGLLNVTFGNMAELILAIFVLRTGNINEAVVVGLSRCRTPARISSKFDINTFERCTRYTLRPLLSIGDGRKETEHRQS